MTCDESSAYADALDKEDLDAMKEANVRWQPSRKRFLYGPQEKKLQLTIPRKMRSLYAQQPERLTKAVTRHVQKAFSRVCDLSRRECFDSDASNPFMSSVSTVASSCSDE